MKYQKPEMEYIGFEDCDIVTASGGSDTPIIQTDEIVPEIESIEAPSDF